jgi:type II secretory pathway component PulF
VGVFAYQAVDLQQHEVRGRVAAESARQARDKLRSEGLRVTRMSDVQTPATARPYWSRRLPLRKLSIVWRELATLLGVGIPLVEAIETIRRQHRGRVHDALLVMQDKIEAGASLAEALQEVPGLLDPLAVHMIEVGERTGSLDHVLSELATFREKTSNMKDRVISALIYPAVVLATSLGVSVFLMTVVVPMLLVNLVDTGKPLPWPTRVLKGGSDLLVCHGALVAGLCVGALVLGIGLGRTRRGKLALQRLFLAAPVVGKMAQLQTLSRIAFVMSTLIRTGIVYLQSVDLAARSTNNVVYRQALEKSGQAIAAGTEIAGAMEATGVFPPLMIQVFAVGQQAGNLDDLLAQLAESYDQQVANMSLRLTAILEPLLIVILAVFVGFILFATLLPILEASHVL